MPFLLRATPRLDLADWSVRSEANLTATGHSRDTPGQTHDATKTRNVLHSILHQGNLLGVTPEEFVAVLRELAVEGVAADEVSVLRKPPGRSPWPVHLSRSHWFNGLDPNDQQMIADVVKSSAFAATFSLCAILDGVAAFDPMRGSLRLTYVAPNGDETVLNDPDRCELHAELRGDGPPP